MNFLDTFSRKAYISNLIKIDPVAVELFHADGQTEMTLIVAFHNFAKGPKMYKT